MARLETKPLRGKGLLRTLNALVPLRRKYGPLIKLLNREGVLEVPYAGYTTLMPATWPKAVAYHYLWQQWSVPEFRLVRDALAELERGTIIDVGANLGHFALLMRDVTDRPMICFEPEPTLFALLDEMVRRNALDGIECRNLACGQLEGELIFDVGANGAVHFAGDVRESVRVEVTTLDLALAEVEEISLVKIDTEGYEVQVLDGAKAILKKHRPVLYVELHPHFVPRYGRTVEDLLDMVDDYGEARAWIFLEFPPSQKMRRSFHKFLRPKARELSGLDEVRDLCTRGRAPAQVYLLVRPRD